MGKIVGGWQLNGIWSYQTGAHWEPFDSAGRSFKVCTGGVCSPSPACSSASTFVSAGCVNVGGDFNLDGQKNDRPNAQAGNVSATHDMWSGGWGPNYVGFKSFFSSPCGGTGPCIGNLGRNSFVGPNFFDMDMSLFKNFKITERVNFQFRAESFNLLNRTNFTLPGNSGHNNIVDSLFGHAGATSGNGFGPRNLQFGAKISF
jgi:hypothetical protein